MNACTHCRQEAIRAERKCTPYSWAPLRYEVTYQMLPCRKVHAMIVYIPSWVMDGHDWGTAYLCGRLAILKGRNCVLVGYNPQAKSPR